MLSINKGRIHTKPNLSGLVGLLLRLLDQIYIFRCGKTTSSGLMSVGNSFYANISKVNCVFISGSFLSHICMH